MTNLLSIPVDIAKGDWVSAGLDLLGAIPIAGEPADLAKVGLKAGKFAGAVNPSTKKTIVLPVKEYAHVMSEISTHITETQKSQKIIIKAIGDFIYTFENLGDNMYRIIGKELIK